MIGKVTTKDGQKIVEPISGSIPTGNPVGTLLTTFKKIQPRNYLYCDGSTFNASQYPALYLYLGTNVLPDYRECVMVGAEENTTDTIATHDVYSQGEFKDDQNKVHHHKIYGRTAGGASSISNAYPISTHGLIAHASSNLNYAETTSVSGSTNNIIGDEGGNVARGKRKAVYVYIKAVDGVDISDEDTFLVTVKNFVDERVTRAESYSTEEQWTGGYWIDGKKIYRRVVSCGALPNNTTKSVAHNIANISWIVKYNGMASDGNEWLQLPASYYSNSAIGLFVDGTNIALRPYTNRTTYTTTLVTIEYTKTTD